MFVFMYWLLIYYIIIKVMLKMVRERENNGETWKMNDNCYYRTKVFHG